MAIYVVGDTHGDYDWSKLNTVQFPEQKRLTRADYVIVLGDWGGVWDGGASDSYVQKWYEEKNFTTLFVDGNHENFDALTKYPVVEWNGGKVQFITPHIIHLMRGQIYTIEGKTFFVMGGAPSTDKYRRTEGVSWWAQEVPTSEELYEGLNNLDAVGNKVDFVLTHTAPYEVAKLALNAWYVDKDPVNQYLEVVAETVDYGDWYFGHWHTDIDYGKFHGCYHRSPRRIV